jgi:hypothetical protein
VITTTMLIPPEPKEKGCMELSAAGLSEHLLRHTTSKKSKHSSKSSHTSSKDTNSDVSIGKGHILRKIEAMIDAKLCRRCVCIRYLNNDLALMGW